MSEESVKHTPGPWRIEESGYGRGGYEYFIRSSADRCHYTICTVTDDNDANLIAAAPDLLAVLNVTAAMLAFEAQCHEESGDEKRRKCAVTVRKQVEAARAVIDKAMGIS